MSVLNEIVARKRVDVAARREARGPIEHLVPSDRSLADALAQPGCRFIMECKRSSPSKGSIAPGADSVEVAAAYSPVASAISVLCDGPYFGGSLADLAAVRANTHLPVLCKDFVVEAFQVREAREAGADAILLMLSVLDDATYRECADEAARWGVDVLTEVRDEAELARALALGADIVGINNRNLDTLQVDPATTSRLAPGIPDGVLVVSESGLASRADVAAVARFADGFLVGSHLMAQPDLAAAARELVFGRVKVCGLTTEADVVAARDAGATWGGLVFATSPRRITREAARPLVRLGLPMVGVFVNEAPDVVAEFARELGLAAVQLHGEESADDIARVRAALPASVQVWQAHHGGLGERSPHADFHVVDAARRGEVRGGTGQTFDWSTLPADLSDVLVAGGLDPSNVAQAARLGGFGLDVSSGVEASPGHKDPAKLQALFHELRGTCRTNRRPS